MVVCNQYLAAVQKPSLTLGLGTAKKKEKGACGEEADKEPTISCESATLLALISLQVLVNAVIVQVGLRAQIIAERDYT